MAAAAAARISNVISLFAIQLLSARHLSVHDYATFATLSASAYVIGIVLPLGIQAAIVRILTMTKVGAGTTETHLYTTSAISFVALLGTLFTIVATVFCMTSLPEPVPITLTSAWIAIVALRSVNTEIYRGNSQFIKYNLSMGAASNASAALILLGSLFLGHNFSTSAIIALVVFLHAIPTIKNSIEICRNAHCFVGVRLISAPHVRRLVRSGIPLLAAILFISQSRELSIIISSYALSPTQTSYFAAAIRLSNIALTPAMLSYAIIAQKAASSFASNSTQVDHRLIRTQIFLVTMFSGLTSLPLLLLPSEALTLTYGADYASAWLPLIILTASQVLMVAAGPADQALALAGRQSTLLILSIASGVAIVGFTLLGAIVGELIGASVGAATALLLRATCGTLAVRIELGMWVTPLFDASYFTRNEHG
ncbi:lipopolysaccharide biosynthesis protein [Phenylobacterium sp.]